MNVLEQIKEQVENNPVIIYMKGTPQFPQCGFSARTVQALQACGVEFTSVDVLANPEIRQNMRQYSNWPTFPQVFIKGELVGGCDITLELYQKGELKKMLDATVAA